MKELEKVIGYENVKIEFKRIIDMMTNPEKYKNLGASITKGLLLYGEPGVGKTLMAKCFIKDSKRKAFIVRKDSPDGSFVKKIKAVFENAGKNTPSIIFLDDMDKFANEDENHRNADEFVTIQSCIDEYHDKDIFVIATANDLRSLPDSLLRVGRFDKKIEIVEPCFEDAKKIIAHYLKKKKVSKEVDIDEVTRLLKGGTCAELETVINEAGVYSGYENKKEIDREDIIKSFMRVIYKAPEDISGKVDNYAYKTAIHEAGHTVVSEILEPNSINIVSIKGHEGKIGGFAEYQQSEDYFKSIHFMENRVMSLLAGKAATEVIFQESDVGCTMDIERAHNIVSRFIDDYCTYGFNLFENTTCKSSQEIISKKETLVAFQMQQFYNKTKKILIDNKEFLVKIAEELVKKKYLIHDEIKQIKKECFEG